MTLLLLLLLAQEATNTTVASDDFILRPATRTIALTGFTRARATLDLIPEVAAKCLDVRYDVGDVVTDAAFATLDDTFVALERKANADQRALLENRIQYLERELGKSRALFDKKALSETVLDELQHQLDQAKLQHAQVLTADQVLKERQDRHTLKAPEGWRVATRRIEPQQWVAAGMPVAGLGDFRTLHVPFALDHEQMAALEAPVTLTVAGETRKARIHAVAPNFDPQTRKTEVVLAIDDPPEQRGGLRVLWRLIQPTEDEWLAPQDAVEKRFETFWVRVERGGDTLEIEVNALGSGDGGRLRIRPKTAGALQNGDRLLAVD